MKHSDMLQQFENRTDIFKAHQARLEAFKRDHFAAMAWLGSHFPAGAADFDDRDVRALVLMAKEALDNVLKICGRDFTMQFDLTDACKEVVNLSIENQELKNRIAHMHELIENMEVKPDGGLVEYLRGLDPQAGDVRDEGGANATGA